MNILISIFSFTYLSFALAHASDACSSFLVKKLFQGEKTSLTKLGPKEFPSFLESIEKHSGKMAKADIEEWFVTQTFFPREKNAFSKNALNQALSSDWRQETRKDGFWIVRTIRAGGTLGTTCWPRGAGA